MKVVVTETDSLSVMEDDQSKRFKDSTKIFLMRPQNPKKILNTELIVNLL